MINAIIFSKDRACQCDLTISSILKNSCEIFSRITVLYTASTDEFDKGYTKLRNKWRKEINFVRETNFQKDLVFLTHSTQPFTCYFTDDDIFYRELKIEGIYSSRPNDFWILNDSDFCCFSLRLGKNTVVQDCHRGVTVEPPHMDVWQNEVRYWDWQDYPGTNFGYPLSVDGHIFSTNMLMRFINEFEYDNPNSFEGRIQQFNNKLPPRMACFETSCVVNTPLNRVQETCTNLAGEYYPISAEDFNKYWLDNYYIDLDKISFSGIVGCHQELPIYLTLESDL